MCPYGRRVMAMPKAYRDRGTRIFIFAGADAWACSREYLDAGEIHEARTRYVLVCPPHMPARDDEPKRPFKSWNCSWPVHGLDVLVIDCRLSDLMREQLVMALQRDGAASADLILYAQGLQWFQPWPAPFGRLRADLWDEELEPPPDTALWRDLVGAMVQHLDTCEFTEPEIELLARYLAAPAGSAAAVAVTIAWRHYSLKQRMMERAARLKAAA